MLFTYSFPISSGSVLHRFSMPLSGISTDDCKVIWWKSRRDFSIGGLLDLDIGTLVCWGRTVYIYERSGSLTVPALREVCCNLGAAVSRVVDINFFWLPLQSLSEFQSPLPCSLRSISAAIPAAFPHTPGHASLSWPPSWWNFSLSTSSYSR